MKGYLIVNGFVNTDKFNEIYEMLLSAADEEGIKLELKKTTELVPTVYGRDVFPGDKPDFAIFWDKDINLAKQLEYLGVRLFNRSSAIYGCDNKAQTYLTLYRHKIAMPKTVIAPKTFEGIGYNDHDFIKASSEKLGFPLIIKEVYGSFGQQVYLADDLGEAENIIARLDSKEFIMQEFIKSSSGKDIRINVVGGKAVASMLRYNDNDFRSNISNGGKMKNYSPNDETKAIAVAAAAALELDFAGVDVLFGPDDESLICEVNSNPHFISTLKATGINIAPLIMKHIKETLG